MALTRKRKIFLLWWYRRKSLASKRRHWIHPICRDRGVLGELKLLPQIFADDKKCLEYFRMTPTTFQSLLKLCASELQKQNTNWRKAITPKERLVVTLSNDSASGRPEAKKVVRSSSTTVAAAAAAAAAVLVVVVVVVVAVVVIVVVEAVVVGISGDSIKSINSSTATGGAKILVFPVAFVALAARTRVLVFPVAFS
ncbi:hypothetical protein ElyMa_000894900 [Elysia marginata]|uniref:Uncharacterized protein n=1 Tax=Elysia marginata TaxID=1093978 RepID=A0AAV4H8V9_9GAST|nr:hypothetical protein ElyMa_000894900 [Elysia marginata]